MKQLTLILLASFLMIACSDDDDPTGPSDPSKDGAVLISGGGSSTEFDTFEYAVIPFFNWLVISSINGTDTLIITLFDYESKGVNTAISLTDSALFVIGTYGSHKFSVFNFGTTDQVSGSITFTSMDTTGNFAAKFSSNAKLANFEFAKDQFSTATIAGDFVATKITVSANILSFMRRNEIVGFR